MHIHIHVYSKYNKRQKTINVSMVKARDRFDGGKLGWAAGRKHEEWCNSTSIKSIKENHKLYSSSIQWHTMNSLIIKREMGNTAWKDRAKARLSASRAKPNSLVPHIPQSIWGPWCN